MHQQVPPFQSQLSITSSVFAIFLLVVFCAPAHAEPGYKFVRKFYPKGFDNIAICPKHKLFLGVDRYRNAVTVLNAETGARISTIGEVGPVRSEDGFFNTPFGIACDEERNRILVSDTGNQRIQFFNIEDFSLAGSVPTSSPYATLAISYTHKRVYAIAVDRKTLAPPGKFIQSLDADTLQSREAPLSLSWKEGTPHEREMYAYDLAVNDKAHKLYVVDYGNARFVMFDLAKHNEPPGVAGVPTGGFYDYGLPEHYPNKPTGIAVDNVTGDILVVDDRKTKRIQVFSKGPHKAVSFRDPTLNTPEKLAVYDGRLFVVDSDPATGDRHVNLYERVGSNR